MIFFPNVFKLGYFYLWSWSESEWNIKIYEGWLKKPEANQENDTKLVLFIYLFFLVPLAVHVLLLSLLQLWTWITVTVDCINYFIV